MSSSNTSAETRSIASSRTSAAAKTRKRRLSSPQSTTKPSARHSVGSNSRSTGRPRRIPWSCTGSCSSSVADLDPMLCIVPHPSVGAETRLPSRDEGYEAAGDGAQDGGALGRPHDDLEPLAVGGAHRDDEATARLQLVVERGRRLERGRGNGDRG